MEYERDSPKVNWWCAFICDLLIGPKAQSQKIVWLAGKLCNLSNTRWILLSGRWSPSITSHFRDHHITQFPNRWMAERTHWMTSEVIGFHFSRLFLCIGCVKILVYRTRNKTSLSFKCGQWMFVRQLHPKCWSTSGEGIVS